MITENKLTLNEITKVFTRYPSSIIAIFDDVSDKMGMSPVYDKFQGIDTEQHKIFSEFTKYEYNEIKQVLKQLQFMSTEELYKVCSAYDSMTIGGTKAKDWVVTRDRLQADIKIPKDKYLYTVDFITGEVSNACNGRLLKTGSNGNVFEFYRENNIAYPLYNGIGHWANGKLPFEVGLAIPDRRLLNDCLMAAFFKDLQRINDWIADKELRGINLHDLATYNQTIEDLCAEHKLDINSFF